MPTECALAAVFRKLATISEGQQWVKKKALSCNICWRGANPCKLQYEQSSGTAQTPPLPPLPLSYLSRACKHESQDLCFPWFSNSLVLSCVFVAQAQAAALDAAAAVAAVATGPTPGEGEAQSDGVEGLGPVSAKPSSIAGAAARGVAAAFQRHSNRDRRRSNSTAGDASEVCKSNGGGRRQVRRPSALPVVANQMQVHAPRPCRRIRNSSNKAPPRFGGC